MPPIEPTVRFEGPWGDATAATIEAVVPLGPTTRTKTSCRPPSPGLRLADSTRPNWTHADQQAGNPDLRRKRRSGRGRLRPSPVPTCFPLAPLKPSSNTPPITIPNSTSPRPQFGRLLLLVLLIVLALEQLFAWSCGYHVSSRKTNLWHLPAVGNRNSSRLNGETRPGMMPSALWLLAEPRHDEIRVGRIQDD